MNERKLAVALLGMVLVLAIVLGNNLSNHQVTTKENKENDCEQNSLGAKSLTELPYIYITGSN